MKEKIESYGTSVFKQQNWERIREHVVRDHPSEASKFWNQIYNKWEKLKQHHYKEMNIHNVMSDNAELWKIWFNIIDEVFWDTTKVDGVHGSMDNDEDMSIEE